MSEQEVRAEIIEGLRQSAAGEVVDLGSFEKYADEPIDIDALIAEARRLWGGNVFVARLADALTAVSAERERFTDTGGWFRRSKHLEADRDRLHKAITEALELIHPSQFMTPGEPGYLGTTRDAMGARRILRAALDHNPYREEKS